MLTSLKSKYGVYCNRKLTKDLYSKVNWIIIRLIKMKQEDDFVCPMPMKWNEIYTSLLKVWEKTGKDSKDKPPVPLILAAWHDAPGPMKLLRWKDTIAWANNH